MKSNTERVPYLFDRFYKGTITDIEKQELFLSLNSLNEEQLSDLIAQAFNDLDRDKLEKDDAKAEQELNKMLYGQRMRTENKERSIFSVWRGIAAAACILIFLSFGVYSYLHHAPTKKVIKNRMAHDAVPGTNKAILTLGNGETIMLDSAKDGILANQGNLIVQKTKSNQIVYAAASGRSADGKSEINKIATPRGGQYQVELPDGSKAWLNASSSISFPVVFDHNRREVEVTGEVYFEVSKKKTPFIVRSDKASIEVLGTHFNVMAYANEAAMEITLLEGSVRINSGNTNRLLKPGQQAQLAERGSVRIEDNVDINEVVAWKNGLFLFKDTDIDAVMRQISRWYDLEINYEDQRPHMQITGKISRNVNASEILSMLDYTGVKFKIEGKTIIIVK